MSPRSRKCAFCGDSGLLTSEHVFPDCFQRSLKLIATAKTKDGEKAIASAQQLRDVCATCNNEILSPLDEYFCKMNAEYFSKIVRPGDSVRFKFDFASLSRALLKIVYNVARSRGWPLKELEQLTDYILGKAQRPDDLRIFLQFLVPSWRPTGDSSLQEITRHRYRFMCDEWFLLRSTSSSRYRFGPITSTS
jgi:hypothetical protein